MNLKRSVQSFVLLWILTLAIVSLVPVSSSSSIEYSDVKEFLFSELNQADYVPGELLVHFYENVTHETISETIARLGTEVKMNMTQFGMNLTGEYWPNVVEMGFNLTKFFSLKITDNRTVWEVVHLFENEATVEFAEPNFIQPLTVHQLYPSDPRFSDQWNLLNAGQTAGTIDADIDMPQAWSLIDEYNLWRNGNPVVAVIDTGVDTSHPDLAGNLFDGFSFVPPVGFDPFDAAAEPLPGLPPGTLFSHGTFVSGIIGAIGDNPLNIAGVNWHALIMPLRAGTPDGFSREAFVSSMAYAIFMKLAWWLTGGLLGANVRVINYSAGGPIYDITGQLWIALAGACDILFVTAAGNEALDVDIGEYIYWDFDDSETITSLDDRLSEVTAFHTGPAHPPQKDATRTYAAGTEVAAGDWDALAATPLIKFLHEDIDGDGVIDPMGVIWLDLNTNGNIDPGELFFYLDNDRNGMVSVNDGRIEPVGLVLGNTEIVFRFVNNVAAGDPNVGLPLVGLGTEDLDGDGVLDLIEGYVDSDGDGWYSPGEPIYLDDDLNGRVSSDDLRLKPPAGMPAGSFVDLFDPDWLRVLRAFRYDERHVDNQHVDGRPRDVPNNWKYDGPASYPCNYPLPNIISVAASNHLDHIADFSNYGRISVDLAAPGEDIPSLLFDGAGVGFDGGGVGWGVFWDDGTSYAAPHVSGVASLAFAMFPWKTALEVKNDILFGEFGQPWPCISPIPTPPASGVDRRPPFGVPPNSDPILVSDGRLRYPYTGDLGDAPITYDTVAALGGALHWDDGNEWFGLPLGRGFGECSNEVDALWPAPYDEDVLKNPNLPCSVIPDNDHFDHPQPVNFWFNPPPPWIPGQPVTVFYYVSTNYLGVWDAEGGRYQSIPNRLIYVNGFFDWNWNGLFDVPAEHTVLQPHDLSLIAPPGAFPAVSPPITRVLLLSSVFVAQGDVPRWIRFRLDYGEHVGLVNPDPPIPPPPTPAPVWGVPGFSPDQIAPVWEHMYRARFGEVEDFPLKNITGPYIDIYSEKIPFNGYGLNQLCDVFAPQEEVTLYAYVSYRCNPVQNKPVAFEVKNPTGESYLYRTNTTDENGVATISFRIPWPCEDPEETVFGNWTVYATVDIAEHIVNDTLTFKVGWIVEITQVETVDVYGDAKTIFAKGEHVHFNLTVQNIAFTTKTATLTIVVYDECGVPIGLVTLQDWVIRPGKTEIFIIDLQIPKWAYIGVATIYANAYTNMPQDDGTPTCPEESTNFIITKT